MSDEVENQQQAEPWKDLGFDTFSSYQEHQETQANSLKTQFESAQKLIGRQGDELGSLRAAIEKLGVKVENGKISANPEENKGEPASSAPAIDYKSEVSKLEQSLTAEQKEQLDAHFKSLTEEDLQKVGVSSKNALVKDSEKRYAYLNSFLEAVGEPEVSSFFEAPAQNQQQKSTVDAVRELFSNEDRMRKLGLPLVESGGVVTRQRGSSENVGKDPQADYASGRVQVQGGDLLGALKSLSNTG